MKFIEFARKPNLSPKNFSPAPHPAAKTLPKPIFLGLSPIRLWAVSAPELAKIDYHTVTLLNEVKRIIAVEINFLNEVKNDLFYLTVSVFLIWNPHSSGFNFMLNLFDFFLMVSTSYKETIAFVGTV